MSTNWTRKPTEWVSEWASNLPSQRSQFARKHGQIITMEWLIRSSPRSLSPFLYVCVCLCVCREALDLAKSIENGRHKTKLLLGPIALQILFDECSMHDCSHFPMSNRCDMCNLKLISLQFSSSCGYFYCSFGPCQWINWDRRQMAAPRSLLFKVSRQMKTFGSTIVIRAAFRFLCTTRLVHSDLTPIQSFVSKDFLFRFVCH